MPRKMRAIGAAMLVVAILGVFVTAAGDTTPANAADEYPTWADVEAARGNAGATETEVTRINGLLGQLETRAAALGDAAVAASGAASVAEAELALARERATSIEAQLDTASEQADDASVQLGRLGAQLYRSGAGELVYRLLLTNDPDVDLLYQLGVSTRLSETTRAVQDRALKQQNVVATLEKQAALAAKERDRLSAQAQRQADEAVAAEQAATAQLAEKRANADVLIAQLAALKNTTAAVEEAYRAGVAAEEERKRQEEEERRRQNEANNPGGGGGTGTAPPPSGIIVDPAGARAYAASAIGGYGWGEGEYNCLVLLWNRESGWRADAYNASSGAYGIPQSLPGSKMASAGDDWRINAATQINWGLGYIDGRYGSPCGAWQHSEEWNWY
ncbi:coiled-coil domain-containing protein [Glaciibacter superstes]|uniref:coiled-coil domain-containing protein n=1 Tax=Glaciibacter superstes TaxID=501023 RepID=UPI0004050557|nr:hypothetical protein [Glaciibacter superstes]